MKWWSGGLGRTADHSIIMAQLYTPVRPRSRALLKLVVDFFLCISQDGKDGKLVKRGPFPFIVPIRDRKTRELLPGRIIMDIGPKAGYPMYVVLSRFSSTGR